jgi:hypothetical protein
VLLLLRLVVVAVVVQLLQCQLHHCVAEVQA